MIKIEIQYFAALREARGLSRETVSTKATTPAALYEELSVMHKFKLPLSDVKAAVNNEVAELDQPLNDGDTVVFIPPVAGG